MKIFKNLILFFLVFVSFPINANMLEDFVCGNYLADVEQVLEYEDQLGFIKEAIEDITKSKEIQKALDNDQNIEERYPSFNATKSELVSELIKEISDQRLRAYYTTANDAGVILFTWLLYKGFTTNRYRINKIQLRNVFIPGLISTIWLHYRLHEKFRDKAERIRDLQTTIRLLSQVEVDEDDVTFLEDLIEESKINITVIERSMVGENSCLKEFSPWADPPRCRLNKELIKSQSDMFKHCSP